MTVSVPGIPTDSADVAELREAHAERDQLEARHRARCRGGWLGEDPAGRPVACPVCKPHLHTGECRVCRIPRRACERARERGTCCCHGCDHPAPADLAELLDQVDTHAAAGAR